MRQVTAEDIGLAHLSDTDLSIWITWKCGQLGNMVTDPAKTVMLLEMLTRLPAPNEHMVQLTLLTDFIEARLFYSMRYESHASSLGRRVAEVFAMVHGWGKCCDHCTSR